jgi:hypothetical protein
MARRVCDLENLVNEEAIARVGLQRQVKKNIYIYTYVCVCVCVQTTDLIFHCTENTKICRHCMLLKPFLLEISISTVS